MINNYLIGLFIIHNFWWINAEYGYHQGELVTRAYTFLIYLQLINGYSNVQISS